MSALFSMKNVFVVSLGPSLLSSIVSQVFFRKSILCLAMRSLDHQLLLQSNSYYSESLDYEILPNINLMGCVISYHMRKSSIFLHCYIYPVSIRMFTLFEFLSCDNCIVNPMTKKSCIPQNPMGVSLMKTEFIDGNGYYNLAYYS